MLSLPACVHPDFLVFFDSWQLALHADGYPETTRRSYAYGMRDYTTWLAEHAPGVGPLDVTRDHVRGWLVWCRDSKSQNTARGRFAGVRHFHGWLVRDEERDDDPTRAVRMPPPGQVQTPVLTDLELRKLIGTTRGNDLRNRRDRAIILLFLDAGLRRAEMAGLTVDDVDVRDRVVYVHGKGSRRSGPRHRAVAIGVKTAQAIDRYMRLRRQHPYAGSAALWLGDRNRGPLTVSAIEALVERRAALVGLDVHLHQLRHTWAHAFRAAGGSEGDLMVLGGWRNRQMLDRYGASVAADRARDAYRRLSLGDRL